MRRVFVIWFGESKWLLWFSPACSVPVVCCQPWGGDLIAVLMVVPHSCIFRFLATLAARPWLWQGQLWQCLLVLQLLDKLIRDFVRHLRSPEDESYWLTLSLFTTWGSNFWVVVKFLQDFWLDYCAFWYWCLVFSRGRLLTTFIRWLFL